MEDKCICCGECIPEGQMICEVCAQGKTNKAVMHLKDLLKNEACMIMYRCNGPKDCPDEDILFGYCQWTGEELEPLDGDSYGLMDVIEKYEWDKEMLVVWIEVEWDDMGNE